MKPYTLLLLLFTILSTGKAQTIHPSVLENKWRAFWICVPNEPAQGYGIYNFRKVVTLAEKPSSFIIHVSGDNRYKLFVNNELVSVGPARGDLFHWNFETVDISSFLKQGDNSLSAIVWNFGDQRPMAQVSNRTAFIVQGNTAAEEIVNTNKTWKCIRDESYEALTPDLLYTYYVSGPGEHIDFNRHSSTWHRTGYNDQSWKVAQEFVSGVPKGVFDWSHHWMLVPSTLPQMELKQERFASIRKIVNMDIPEKKSHQLPPSNELKFTLPTHKKVIILLDQQHLTNAYPVLKFSKGKDAHIKISYAEALYKIEDTPDWKAQHQKGNRNEIEGKRFVGVHDELISNGTDNQVFTSLSWRTYRYVQLEIETKEQPLLLDDFYGLQTGYPFTLNASFKANDAELDKIIDVGWRTARLCAMETYMDCPYYEQLQYVGDIRIQALVSLFNSGDDRLMRNAITTLDNSRMAEGITLSRYPSTFAQQIPPFSLWWIGMVHDYWMYRNDEAFVKSKLPGMRQVLGWFNTYQQADGSLKNSPYWNFTDWAQASGWNFGVAPVGTDGSSCVVDLQLCWAYSLAATLERALGLKELADQYQSSANQLKETIQKKYWDQSKMLFADETGKKFFSQHSNTLAILTGVVTGNDAHALMEKVITDVTLTKATIYFNYYVHRALVKAGRGDTYLSLLQDWRDQLANGLTTWAEVSDYNNARSDCHGWGSSPNIEFFRIVLGIDSDAPGFKKIRIEPHLGKLTEAQGTMPHPDGTINVHYFLKKSKWQAEVSIPKNTTGIFVWNEKKFDLRPGEVNQFIF